MAYRTSHKFKIDVNATHDFDEGPSAIISVVVHVDLAWDDSGRHWWDCVGWHREGSEAFVRMADESDPLGTIVHAMVLAHMEPYNVERIISAKGPRTGNVIDLKGQRRLRRMPVAAAEQDCADRDTSDQPA